MNEIMNETLVIKPLQKCNSCWQLFICKTKEIHTTYMMNQTREFQAIVYYGYQQMTIQTYIWQLMVLWSVMHLSSWCNSCTIKHFFLMQRFLHTTHIFSIQKFPWQCQSVPNTLNWVTRLRFCKVQCHHQVNFSNGQKSAQTASGP